MGTSARVLPRHPEGPSEQHGDGHRPSHDHLVEKDPQGKPQPPVKVTGNTVWMDGDSIVSSSGERRRRAAGAHRHRRLALRSTPAPGLLRLMRTPKIVGTKGRPFTLVGETIDLLTKQRKLDRVLSKNAAEATSEDLNLKSDTIDLRVTDDLLQRAIAGEEPRARDLADAVHRRRFDRRPHAGAAACARCTPSAVPWPRVRPIRSKFRHHREGSAHRRHDRRVLRYRSPRRTPREAAIRDCSSRSVHATSLQHIAASDTTVCDARRSTTCAAELITSRFDSGARSTRWPSPIRPCGGGVYIEPKPDSRELGAGLAPRGDGARPSPPARPLRGDATPPAARRRAPPAADAHCRPSRPGAHDRSTRARAARESAIQALVERLARGDRSTALALHALITAADDDGMRHLQRRRRRLPRATTSPRSAPRGATPSAKPGS